jgi:hypothetical protein
MMETADFLPGYHLPPVPLWPLQGTSDRNGYCSRLSQSCSLRPSLRSLIPLPEATVAAVNPVAQLLANKRSPATQRAYRSDLCDFFGGEPRSAQVEAFIKLPTSELALRLNCYKADLLSRGVAEATINRRLAAVRALLKCCLFWLSPDPG